TAGRRPPAPRRRCCSRPAAPPRPRRPSPARQRSGGRSGNPLPPHPETRLKPPRPSRPRVRPGRRPSPEDHVSKRVRDVIVVVQLIGHGGMSISFMTVGAVRIGHRCDLPKIFVGHFLLRVGQLQETLPRLVIFAL